MVGRYNPEIHTRRSMRLRGYDYSSSGAYFVTVCTKNKECLFGNIVDGAMELNEAGKITQTVWDELPMHYAAIDLDAFVIMPNHVHGIIVLTGTSVVGAGLALPGTTSAASSMGAASSAPTLGNVMRTFKSLSAIRVNRVLMRTGQPPWQRNYYEHIIRNEAGLYRIREYIVGNPQNWMMDPENPTHGPVPHDFETELG